MTQQHHYVICSTDLTRGSKAVIESGTSSSAATGDPFSNSQKLGAQVGPTVQLREVVRDNRKGGSQQGYAKSERGTVMSATAWQPSAVTKLSPKLAQSERKQSKSKQII